MKNINPDVEVSFKFKSIEEFNQWKKDIIKEEILKEHVKKLELIDEIITFAMDNPEQIYTLQNFTQIGGDTLEEYFKNIQ